MDWAQRLPLPYNYGRGNLLHRLHTRDVSFLIPTDLQVWATISWMKLHTNLRRPTLELSTWSSCLQSADCCQSLLQNLPLPVCKGNFCNISTTLHTMQEMATRFPATIPASIPRCDLLASCRNINTFLHGGGLDQEGARCQGHGSGAWNQLLLHTMPLSPFQVHTRDSPRYHSG